MTTTIRPKILVTGALGQLGTELVIALRLQHGWENVIATDIVPATDVMLASGPYMRLDVLNAKRLNAMVEHLGIGEIYHLAAVLSAKGETDPQKAWHLNMQGLLNVLAVAAAYRVRKVFWPSSIAVFGPESMKAACVQNSKLDPLTIYGISKQAGEYWCRWYHKNHGLDIRSIRYPGLIGHVAPPGGGTTDYAVEIFHEALQHGRYSCFLKAETILPMLYMPDAIRGTLELMAAPKEELSLRTGYNLGGLHFSPRELAAEIGRQLPGFTITYNPDYRQQIADSWPSGIIDLDARKDWGWKPQYDLQTMVNDMLENLRPKYATESLTER